MTGSEFRDYVVRKFKRTDKDTELYEATTDTIAQIQIKINNATLKTEVAITGINSIGDFKLTLPTDFGQILGRISMEDTSQDSIYPELIKISKERYNALYGDRLLSAVGNMFTGVPKHFAMFDSTSIWVGPVVDRTTFAFQMDYTTENATEIASGTSTVQFTAEFRIRNLLRNGVLFELHDGLENFTEAAYYKALFLDGLNDLEVQEGRNESNDDPIRYTGV